MQRIFLTVVLIFFICLSSFDAMSQRLENVRITLQLTDASLKETMRRIENMTVFKFIAKSEDIENELHVNIQVTNEALDKVLKKILSGRSLEYKQIDNNILIKKSAGKPVTPVPVRTVPAIVRKHSLHGTIKSERTGETVIGATITVVGSSIGAASNEYGFYSLTLAEGEYTIQISAIGMKTKRVQVAMEKNIRLDLLVEEEVKDLEAVTVTAAAPRQKS